MREAIAGGLALVALVAFAPSHADAVSGVLCIKATGKGAVKVRNPTCKPTEVQVGTFDTDASKANFTAICPPDSAPVGDICIDKYEASVWETTDPATIESIQKGEIVSVLQLAAATQRGAAGQEDFGSGCPLSGNGCSDFFAASVPGTTPSHDVSWFQAAAACRNAGKRLATNQEWQMAALGTPDPGTDNGSSDCAVDSFAVATTGSRSSCVSDSGVFDMVGNVAEWVADWAEPASGCDNWSSTFGMDDSCFGGDGSYHYPAPLTRGGSHESGTNAGVFDVQAGHGPGDYDGDGFRCARER